MNEFMLLFRNDLKTAWAQPSPDQMQSQAKQWQDWIGNLVAQGKFVSSGNRLDFDGRVVRPHNVVTDGPYVETKEALAGYMVVRARDYTEAVTIAKACPIVLSGGSVEVRRFVGADGNG